MFPWVAEAACRAGRRGWKETEPGAAGGQAKPGRLHCSEQEGPRAIIGASQGAQAVKGLPASAGDIRDAVSISGLEDALEEEMATHVSVPA